MSAQARAQLSKPDALPSDFLYAAWGNNRLSKDPATYAYVADLQDSAAAQCL